MATGVSCLALAAPDLVMRMWGFVCAEGLLWVVQRGSCVLNAAADASSAGWMRPWRMPYPFFSIYPSHLENSFVTASCMACCSVAAPCNTLWFPRYRSSHPTASKRSRDCVRCRRGSVPPVHLCCSLTSMHALLSRWIFFLLLLHILPSSSTLNNDTRLEM